ncbi:MAG: tryptophan 7-halogenase, partial [Halobacteriaceae archaeon]
PTDPNRHPDAMDSKINDITIVGGGDAGLLTGLCLRELNPDTDISVVDNFQENQTDIGKSTFQAIVPILHDFLGIDGERFVKEVKPIFKASVYFRDWCGYRRFHHPFDIYEVTPNGPAEDLLEQYYYLYDTVYTDPEFRTHNEEMAETGKTPYHFADGGRIEEYPHYAYHLNTDRFNGLLRSLCEDRGVALVNDIVTDAAVDGNEITELHGENDTYTADLYVDASGFNRVLKGAFDGEFRDFDLPLDAAFNVQVDRPLSEVVPATVIETGDFGWFWHIDTFDNRDLGYVYASEYVDDEAAAAEFVEHCGGAVAREELTKYEFTSGYFADAWEGNCVAIGNAEGFVEPLQSTGLTANAQAAQVLSVLLADNGRVNHAGLREKYNAYVRNAWESIYDFISVHYRYSEGDTPFWEDMQSIEISPRVEFIIEEFDTNGETVAESFDFQPLQHNPDTDDLVFFPVGSFHSIMRKMGATSEFYETREFDVSRSHKHEVNQYYQSVEREVEEFLTVEEYYKGLVDVDGVV